MLTQLGGNAYTPTLPARAGPKHTRRKVHRPTRETLPLGPRRPNPLAPMPGPTTLVMIVTFTCPPALCSWRAPCGAPDVRDAARRLFKFAFSNPETAAGELSSVLSPAIVEQLDLRRLAVCPGSFVDQDLAQRHSDLLYSVPATAGTDAFVYVLFEDQSTVDPTMPFRLLTYVVRIWDKHLRDHPGSSTLPPVIPVVLHHGASGTRWNGPTRLSDLVEGSPTLLAAVAPHVPDFAFVLDDLIDHSDEALRRRAMTALGRAALWALKSSRQPGRILQQLPAWAAVFRDVLAAPRGVEALAVVLRCILTVADVAPQELAAAVDRRLGSKGTEAFVTGAQILQQEALERGRREGREEGREAALRVAIRRVLARRSLPVSAMASAKLDTCSDCATLERWLDDAVVAASADDVVR